MYTITIKTLDDVTQAVALTKTLLKESGFSKFEEQKILVSVSELTTNIVRHSGVEGIFRCHFNDNAIHIFVSDEGLGINNVKDVLEGYHQPKGLGLGLIGVQRLMDEFFIETKQGKGVTIWTSKKK